MKNERKRLRYDDYRMCADCRTVNHLSMQNCRRCGSENRETLKRGAGSVWYLYVAMFLSLVASALPGSSFALMMAAGTILFFFAARYHWRLRNLENEAWELHTKGADEKDSYLVNAHETGIVQWQQGDNDAAVQSFSLALSGGMTPLPTRFALAVALYNTGDYARALPLLEEIQFSTHAPPAPSGAAELLARTYLEVGAVNAYQLNFLRDFRLSAIDQRLRRRIDTMLGFQPEALLAAGGWAPMPVAAEPPQPAVTFPGAAARSLLERGDAAGAAALCEQAGGSEMAPDMLEIYTHALDRLGRVDDAALEAYQKQLASNPADVPVRVRLCEGLVTRQRYREAIGACRMGLQIAPDVRLRCQLATVFLLNGNYQSALAELQALERTAGYETVIPEETVRRLMGRCLTGQGLLTAALRQLQRADRSQEALDALYDLGRLLEEKGDMENARTCWEEIYVADVTYRDVAMKLRQ
jgi:tetratricopeptide (TPR) repeat protein